MKTRISFVSNSSSSSFVVIPQMEVVTNASLSPEELKEHEDFVRRSILDEIAGLELKDGKWQGLFREGEKEFSWQTRAYYDLPSKWNWMVLQAGYSFAEDRCTCSEETDDKGKYRMAVDGYLAGLGLPAVDWDEVEMLENGVEAYIDHQSRDAMGTFAEIDRIGITGWLYNPHCFVHNGNDNG